MGHVRYMKRYKNDCRFKGKKILIADDCVEITRLISAVLSPTGAEVIEVLDGKEALAKINDNQFDLIMLDIHMPGMDGITATKIIKNCVINYHTPIIIISSDHDLLEVSIDTLPGVEGFIEKPFRPIDFLNKMADVFDPEGKQGSQRCLGDDCKNKNFKNCAIFNKAEFKLCFQDA